MKPWKRALLAPATALALAPLLAACDDDGTYVNAACVDTVTNVALPNSDCSPGYGAPLGTHSWAYSSYHYDQQEVPVVYVGAPIQRNVYVFQRPARVNVNHFSAPAPTRPPGVTDASVQEPTQSFLTDKRMADVRAKRPELVERARNPNIQRGGFGLPNAKATNAPVPSRTLNSPAPGRVTPPKVPTATASKPSVKAGK